MTDYIPREAAIEALTGWYGKACRPEKMSSYNMGERAAYTTAISEITDLPAAAVRPVVWGKNIGKDYDAVDQFVCSECGIELQGWVRVERDEDTWEETYHEHRFNYCPNCGARMEE